MKDTPRHADSRGREQVGLLEKGHTQKAQKSPRQTVGQGSGIEDEGNSYDADEGNGGGLLPAKAVENEDDGDVGESQLDPGDGGGQRRMSISDDPFSTATAKADSPDVHRGETVNPLGDATAGDGTE